jgi:U3 small nucleolar RNA-associated protein 15
MADFEKTAILPTRRPGSSAEASAWRKYTHPLNFRHKAAPSHIEFSPVSPHDFCVSNSLQVDIFSARTNSVYRTLTRFKDTVCCASYRPDGKMLAASDESGVTQLFDLSSRAVMRTMRGHTKAVRAVRFSPDGSRLFTGSDDTRVLVWDVAAEQELRALEGHSDMVRCVRVSGANGHAAGAHRLLLSGSYDHTVRLWDVSAPKPVMTLRMSEPVEDVALLPGGGMVAVANGNQLTVCDLLSGGKAVQSIVAHSKAITCLHADAHGHLLSGGLDRFVKVYDLSRYKVLSSIKYDAPLLSVALSPTRSHLVAALTNGTTCVRRQRVAAAAADSAPRAARDDPTARPAGARPGQVAVTEGIAQRYDGTHPGTYQYFLRGRTRAPQPDELVAERGAAPRLSVFDKALKGFRYHEALDAALLNGTPEVVVGVLEELVQRSGLRIALHGRNQQTLQPLIAFLVRQITRPPHATVLVGVANLLLDMYAPVFGQSPAVDELFLKLRATCEVRLTIHPPTPIQFTPCPPSSRPSHSPRISLLSSFCSPPPPSPLCRLRFSCSPTWPS